MGSPIKVNDNKFFREIALRICGSLDIEKALQHCFLYVREIIPTSELSLTVYNHDEGILEVVAVANDKGSFPGTDEIHIPPHLRKQLEEPGEYPRVRVSNDIYKDDITRLVAKKFNYPDSSVIVARLTMEDKLVGSLIARVIGKDKYTKEHVRLWSLVNEPAAVALANSQRYLELLKLKEHLADDSKYFQDELRKDFSEGIIGVNFGLREVMEQVIRVAPSLSPVLLYGETGTGKEIIANAIHKLSFRNQGPLIKVNCGAIPESLIDSELFGHEKGAFTGAIAQKRGRFERADGGTIFLDEVSELPLNVQVRLLRVLQEKEIDRVGGTKPIKIDIRIISATNRDLRKLVETGEFRDDLYYRLGVFPIYIPPLRERKGDIPALVEYFKRKKATEMGLRSVPKLAPGATEMLMEYEWPGNVRELNNVIERALIIYREKPLAFDDILGFSAKQNKHVVLRNNEDDLSIDNMEASHIRRIMEITGGRIEGQKGAAILLGIKPGTLRHRMRKLGIPFGKSAKGIKSGKPRTANG